MFPVVVIPAEAGAVFIIRWTFQKMQNSTKLLRLSIIYSPIYFFKLKSCFVQFSLNYEIWVKISKRTCDKIKRRNIKNKKINSDSVTITKKRN